MIRPGPHDADVAQARVFVGLLAEAIAALTAYIDSAEQGAVSAALIGSRRAERQASNFVIDLRADLENVHCQLAALYRRFPSVRADTAELHAVSA